MTVTYRGALEPRHLAASLSEHDGKSLGDAHAVSVWSTYIGSLDYTSLLVVAPLGNSFLRMPLPHINYAVMHACDSRNRLAWISSYERSSQTSRRFNAFLKECGFRRRNVPFGSIAYLGQDMGRAERWGPSLWPGRFRAYAVPGKGVDAQVLEALNEYVQSGGRFCLRRVDAAKSTSMSTIQALFASGSNLDDASIADAISLLGQFLEAPASLSVDMLHPTFQPEDSRLWLTRTVLGEAASFPGLEELSSLRARLIQVIGWPLFVDLAASVIQDDRALPWPDSAEATQARAGLVALSQHLIEARDRFPELVVDPFEVSGVYAA